MTAIDDSAAGLLLALRTGAESAAAGARPEPTDAERRLISEHDALVAACGGLAPVPTAEEWTAAAERFWSVWSQSAAEALAVEDAGHERRFVVRDPVRMVLELHWHCGGDPAGWLWGPMGPPRRGDAASPADRHAAHAEHLGLAWGPDLHAAALAESERTAQALADRFEAEAISFSEALARRAEILASRFDWLAEIAASSAPTAPNVAALSEAGARIAVEARDAAVGVVWGCAADDIAETFAAGGSYQEVGTAAASTVAAWMSLTEWWDARIAADNRHWRHPDRFADGAAEPVAYWLAALDAATCLACPLHDRACDVIAGVLGDRIRPEVDVDG